MNKKIEFKKNKLFLMEQALFNNINYQFQLLVK